MSLSRVLIGLPLDLSPGLSKKPSLIVHVPRDELEAAYRNEKDPRVKERLLAVLHLYEGKSVPEASRAVKRSIRSVKRWLKAWNIAGYGGLKPSFDGGPKPRMQSSEWDRIVEEVRGKNMTLRDVAVYVKTTRGVEYSYAMVWRVLRKEKKVRYGKPYAMNVKRPQNAEEILKKA